MFRHLFMAEFDAGVPEGERAKLIEDMRTMAREIPGIEALAAGRTTGWLGQGDLVMMTVDVADRSAFDAFQAHPYHADYISGEGARLCKPGSFVVGQIEI